VAVEWKYRRLDVLTGLDLLTRPPAEPERWPGVGEGIDWVVNDTFWDQHDPAQDIGVLLVDEREAAAVREVVASVVAICDRPYDPAEDPGSDDGWYAHPRWPVLRDQALRALAVLRGNGEYGDGTGRAGERAAPVAVERPDWRRTLLDALDALAADVGGGRPGRGETYPWQAAVPSWDRRDPVDDAGRLLADGAEVDAVRPVVTALAVVAGRTRDPDAWPADPLWPVVRDLAAQAAAVLRLHGDP
jgi:hypothetical protein